jgi:hypothetical protein
MQLYVDSVYMLVLQLIIKINNKNRCFRMKCKPRKSVKKPDLSGGSNAHQGIPAPELGTVKRVMHSKLTGAWGKRLSFGSRLPARR